MNKRIVIYFLIMMVFGLPAQSYAVELFEGINRTIKKVDDTLEGTGSVVGLGVYYKEQPYKEADNLLFVLPVAIVNYKRFFFSGISAGFHLWTNEQMKLSLIATPRLMGYDGDDSPMLAGMEGRNPSLDGGLRWAWDNKWFLFSVTGQTDLLSQHRGQELKAVVSKPLFKRFFTPRIGVKWQDENLVDYYYGVRPDEAKSGRPAYGGNDAVNMIVGATFAVPLGKVWVVTYDVEYEALDEDIYDSPLIDTGSTFGHTLGVVYRF